MNIGETRETRIDSVHALEGAGRADETDALLVEINSELQKPIVTNEHTIGIQKADTIVSDLTKSAAIRTDIKTVVINIDLGVRKVAE